MIKQLSNGFFKILKVISWVWIAFCVVILFTLKFTTGEPIFLKPIGIFIVLIMASPGICILIWRYKADKKIKIKNQLIEKEKEHEREARRIENEQNLLKKNIVGFKELLDEGIITQEEFERKKAELLSGKK